MLQLSTSLDKIWGVGPRAIQDLKKIKLNTVLDLLYYFPFRWEDWTHPSLISRLRQGEAEVIKAKVVSQSVSRTARKNVFILRAKLADGSGTIDGIWFNQPFLRRVLKVGSEWYFYGKTSFFNHQKVFSVLNFEKEARIFSFYHESGKLTNKFFRRIIKIALSCVKQLSDYLPDFIRSKYQLIDLQSAIANIHQPINFNQISLARQRLGFDELFLLSLLVLKKRSQLNNQKARPCQINKKLLREFNQKLTFTLTAAQRKAGWQIILDLARSTPMNRLLQGDVGSGKTVVALLAVLVNADNHYQSVWMAPTGVLAKQHFMTCLNLTHRQKLSHGKFLTLGLLTSDRALFFDGQKQKKIKKTDLLAKIKTGEIDLVIATHAILFGEIKFAQLNLVIVDEQHRFGVHQRAKLTGGKNIGIHFLSMSATPIPRTLTLTLYGDLDVSRLDELPKGRRRVITRYIPESKRSQIYSFMRKQIQSGRQAFIICPLIEDKEVISSQKLFELDKKSVVKEYTYLAKKIFPDLRLAMLHGKMEPQEKEKIMLDFAAGKTDILVSTAVIEVGVDIPNATLILIEGAEKFGLAQLHQFRGRVGRGAHQSYCFLMSNLGGKTRTRLRALEKEHDGFKLAELDLKMRGPGELAGVRQSGLPDLKMATLFDKILVSKAREAAELVSQRGIENFPQLNSKLKKFEVQNHLE